MIEIRSHFTEWHEATQDEALRFAAVLYGGMTCKNKFEKLSNHIRGVQFTEEQVRDEWRNYSRQRNGESTQ